MGVTVEVDIQQGGRPPSVGLVGGVEVDDVVGDTCGFCFWENADDVVDGSGVELSGEGDVGVGVVEARGRRKGGEADGGIGVVEEGVADGVGGSGVVGVLVLVEDEAVRGGTDGRGGGDDGGEERVVPADQEVMAVLVGAENAGGGEVELVAEMSIVEDEVVGGGVVIKEVHTQIS